MTALSSVMRETSSNVVRELSDDIERARPEIRSAHRKVMEAIREGDAAAAERRMRRHVDAYATLVTPVSS